MTDWRTLSPTELERQFNPRETVADFQEHLDYFAAASAAARARLKGRMDLRYGDGPRQCIDVFPAAAADAPLHVFIHGGYWRALSKDDFSLMAEPLVALGVTTVIAGYDLCPEVTVPQQVAQIRDCLAWVWHQAAELGGNRDRLTISGHSAGGHHVAMALAENWPARGLPADMIKGAASVSGVLDTEMVPQLSVNEDIRLDAAMAQEVNPLHHLPHCTPPYLVAAGERESPGWVSLSRTYAAACRDAGIDCDLLVSPGHDHFSIAPAMCDPETDLGARIIAMARNPG